MGSKKETSVCNKCGDKFSYFPSNKSGNVCSSCSSNHWTEEETNKLRNLYKTESANKISNIIDRTPESIRQKAKRLGIEANKRSSEGKDLVCDICKEKYKHSDPGPSSAKLCSRCYQNKKRRERKQVLVDMSGGGCERCGYDNCLSSLTFHHKDESTKKFSISNRLLNDIDTLKGEVDKCILLCRNCHGEIHCEHCDRKI